MTVHIVTDTTACLPEAVADRAEVTVVPLHISVTGRRTVQAREISPGEVADILSAGKERVSTSMPSPGEFEEVYRGLVGRGVREVVSVHLSGKVSGTVESAGLGAEAVDGECRVEVVDSGVLGLAMGYAVLAGVEAAEAGASVEEVARVVREHAEASRTWFYVDTLEHLRRGGRIGFASALLGSALAIKPLLTIKDGQVHPSDRVRTRTKALATLVDRAAAAVEEAREAGLAVKIAVQQLAADEAAQELAETVRERTGLEPHITEVDPVIGVHVGPGTLGIVVAPQPPIRPSVS